MSLFLSTLGAEVEISKINTNRKNEEVRKKTSRQKQIILIMKRIPHYRMASWTQMDYRSLKKRGAT